MADEASLEQAKQQHEQQQYETINMQRNIWIFDQSNKQLTYDPMT